MDGPSSPLLLFVPSLAVFKNDPSKGGPRVETRVLACAGGGHACLANPLPRLGQGLFSPPRQPFKYQYRVRTFPFG